MVRTESLFVYLPEPPDDVRLPGEEPDQIDSVSCTRWLSSRPVCVQRYPWFLLPESGPVRALVTFEVQQFRFFHLGPTSVVAIDPHGALVERCGPEVVERLKRGLRQQTYPTLGDACAAASRIIFGKTVFYPRVFEALVLPEDAREWEDREYRKLLGINFQTRRWDGVEIIQAISSALACVGVWTIRDPHVGDPCGLCMRLPVMALMPFAPYTMAEDDVQARLAREMTLGKHILGRFPAGSSTAGCELNRKQLPESTSLADSGEVHAAKRKLPCATTSEDEKGKQRRRAATHRTDAEGRLVLLKAALENPTPGGDSGLVHLVTKVDYHESERNGALHSVRMLTLLPLPNGSVRTVPDSYVCGLQSGFPRMWKTAHDTGDKERIKSLYHGWLKFAEDTQPRDVPLFGVLRTLHPGMPRLEAKRHTVQMEKVMGIIGNSLSGTTESRR
jgi:hypothetical protein